MIKNSYEKTISVKLNYLTKKMFLCSINCQKKKQAIFCLFHKSIKKMSKISETMQHKPPLQLTNCFFIFYREF